MLLDQIERKLQKRSRAGPGTAQIPLREQSLGWGLHPHDATELAQLLQDHGLAVSNEGSPSRLKSSSTRCSTPRSASRRSHGLLQRIRDAIPLDVTPGEGLDWGRLVLAASIEEVKAEEALHRMHANEHDGGSPEATTQEQTAFQVEVNSGGTVFFCLFDLPDAPPLSPSQQQHKGPTPTSASKPPPPILASSTKSAPKPVAQGLTNGPVRASTSSEASASIPTSGAAAVAKAPHNTKPPGMDPNAAAPRGTAAVAESQGYSGPTSSADNTSGRECVPRSSEGTKAEQEGSSSTARTTSNHDSSASLRKATEHRSGTAAAAGGRSSVTAAKSTVNQNSSESAARAAERRQLRRRTVSMDGKNEQRGHEVGRRSISATEATSTYGDASSSLQSVCKRGGGQKGACELETVPSASVFTAWGDPEEEKDEGRRGEEGDHGGAGKSGAGGSEGKAAQQRSKYGMAHSGAQVSNKSSSKEFNSRKILSKNGSSTNKDSSNNHRLSRSSISCSSSSSCGSINFSNRTEPTEPGSRSHHVEAGERKERSNCKQGKVMMDAWGTGTLVEALGGSGGGERKRASASSELSGIRGVSGSVGGSSKKREGVAVLKFAGSRLLAQAEQLAGELARHVGVTAPPSRVIHQVGHTAEEWQALETAASSLHNEELLEEMGRVPAALLMVYVAGSKLSEARDALTAGTHPAGASVRAANASITLCEDLGRLFLLDMVLGNADRLPCAELGWRGNSGNVFFGAQGSAFAGHVVAIDACVQRRPPAAKLEHEDEAVDRLAQLVLTNPGQRVVMPLLRDQILPGTVHKNVAASLLRSAKGGAGGGESITITTVSEQRAGVIRSGITCPPRNPDIAAAFQRGMRGALERVVTLKGLLEMMYQRIDEWVTEFIVDVQSVVPSLQAPSARKRPSGHSRGRTRHNRHHKPIGVGTFSAPAPDSQNSQWSGSSAYTQNSSNSGMSPGTPSGTTASSHSTQSPYRKEVSSSTNLNQSSPYLAGGTPHSSSHLKNQGVRSSSGALKDFTRAPRHPASSTPDSHKQTGASSIDAHPRQLETKSAAKPDATSEGSRESASSKPPSPSSCSVTSNGGPMPPGSTATPELKQGQKDTAARSPYRIYHPRSAARSAGRSSGGGTANQNAGTGKSRPGTGAGGSSITGSKNEGALMSMTHKRRLHEESAETDQGDGGSQAKLRRHPSISNNPWSNSSKSKLTRLNSPDAASPPHKSGPSPSPSTAKRSLPPASNEHKAAACTVTSNDSKATTGTSASGQDKASRSTPDDHQVHHTSGSGPSTSSNSAQPANPSAFKPDCEAGPQGSAASPAAASSTPHAAPNQDLDKDAGTSDSPGSVQDASAHHQQGQHPAPNHATPNSAPVSTPSYFDPASYSLPSTNTKSSPEATPFGKYQALPPGASQTSPFEANPSFAVGFSPSPPQLNRTAPSPVLPPITATINPGLCGGGPRDLSLTLALKAVGAEAKRDRMVSSRVAEWRNKFRDHALALKAAADEWQVRHGVERILTCGFLSGGQPVVDLYELKIRLDHMLRRLKVLQAAAVAVAPVRVCPQVPLYLGSASAADAHHVLRFLGISHIINATEEVVEPPPSSGFKVLRIPLRDVDEEDISAHFYTTADFISSVFGLPSQTATSAALGCQAGKPDQGAPAQASSGSSSLEAGPKVCSNTIDRNTNSGNARVRNSQQSESAVWPTSKTDAASDPPASSTTSSKGKQPDALSPPPNVDAAANKSAKLAASCSSTSSSVTAAIKDRRPGTSLSPSNSSASTSAAPSPLSSPVGTKRGVLVHCSEGKSRSVALVVAFMVVAQRKPLAHALHLVRSARPQAAPNAGFCSALVALEYRVLGGSSVSGPGATGPVARAAQSILEAKKPKPKPVVCPLCSEAVGLSTASLNVHIKSRHPKEARAEAEAQRVLAAGPSNGSGRPIKSCVPAGLSNNCSSSSSSNNNNKNSSSASNKSHASAAPNSSSSYNNSKDKKNNSNRSSSIAKRAASRNGDAGVTKDTPCSVPAASGSAAPSDMAAHTTKVAAKPLVLQPSMLPSPPHQTQSAVSTDAHTAKAASALPPVSPSSTHPHNAAASPSAIPSAPSPPSSDPPAPSKASMRASVAAAASKHDKTSRHDSNSSAAISNPAQLPSAASKKLAGSCSAGAAPAMVNCSSSKDSTELAPAAAIRSSSNTDAAAGTRTAGSTVGARATRSSSNKDAAAGTCTTGLTMGAGGLTSIKVPSPVQSPGTSPSATAVAASARAAQRVASARATEKRAAAIGTTQSGPTAERHAQPTSQGSASSRDRAGSRASPSTANGTQLDSADSGVLSPSNTSFSSRPACSEVHDKGRVNSDSNANSGSLGISSPGGSGRMLLASSESQGKAGGGYSKGSLGSTSRPGSLGEHRQSSQANGRPSSGKASAPDRPTKAACSQSEPAALVASKAAASQSMA